MSKKKQNKKIRTEFRKKHDTRTRQGDLTRGFHEHGFEQDESVRSERVSGKGDLTRKRTIVGAEAAADDAGLAVELDVDSATCLAGRVLSIHGLECVVERPDGARFRCTLRGILKSLSTDQRNVIVTGDRVSFSLVGESEGVVERVEPRRGVISRTSRGRQHVLVANIEQMLIVTSAAEPTLKPNLIDRMLVTAEKNRFRPIICINKIDLIDAADLQPLAGVYGQMGYQVLLLSATTGFGIEALKRQVANKDSVVVGQSGVGKSSLLNAIEPDWQLRVSEVSSENQKGKHTTSVALLISLSSGGYIIDTPGIRQFELWDVIPEEVGGYYRDLRPFVSHCRFPDCTHTHEADCAVKSAVADGHLDARRYESFCQLYASEPE